MNKNILICILFIWLITTSGYSIEIPPGPVSGDWYSSGNPYNINGEIYVPADSTLNIHEGVDVIFQGHYKFIVNGFLEAIGTESDSILFTAADTAEGWHSLRFIDAPDSSHLSYCIIQYGRATGSTYEDSLGGGIYGDHSSPVINRCTIRWNSAEESSGGIGFYNNSNPTISYCTISGNSGIGGTGGIGFADHCDPIISHCTINGNDGWGSAIGYNCNPIINHCIISGNASTGIGFMYDCNVTISYCIISDNSTTGYGGGISFGDSLGAAGSIVMIDHCIISGNSAVAGVGGISIGMYSEAHISNCTISNNHSDAYGGGIGCLIGAFVEIKNTIVEGNTGSGGIFFYSSAEAEIDYSDFYNNEPEHFTGSNIPENLGAINSTNANGDPCDQYHNIFLDPLYYSTMGDSAFYLMENSPCIDAGDPFTPPDPDGTTADIGAFYFDQFPGAVNRPKTYRPTEFALHNAYPNPFNSSTNLSFSLPEACEVVLVIYNIQGREIIRLADGFYPPGVHEMAFDAAGLSSGLYFAYLKAGSYNRTQKILLLK